MRQALARLATAAAVMAALVTSVKADSYELDSDHTEVRFTWDHLGMSRQGGRFLDVTGTVEINEADPAASTINVTIPLEGIATGIRQLDDHLLRSKEYFEVDAHPYITFKSTRVTMTGERVAEVVGDLSINGIVKPVTLDVIWNFTGEHPLAKINPTYAGAYSSGFSATTQILRSDWGLTRSIPFVSDELKITIETEMHRTAVSQPAAVQAVPPVDGFSSGTSPKPDTPDDSAATTLAVPPPAVPPESASR
jgi:polyisoprenoid-binding protein YceI